MVKIPVVFAIIALVVLIAIAAIAVPHMPSVSNTPNPGSTSAATSSSTLITSSQAGALMGYSGTGAVYNATYYDASQAQAKMTSLNGEGTSYFSGYAGFLSNITGMWTLEYAPPNSNGKLFEIVLSNSNPTTVANLYSADLREIKNSNNYELNSSVNGFEYSYAYESGTMVLLGYRGGYMAIALVTGGPGTTAKSIATVVSGDLG
jgi:hypothetical protein